METSVEIPDVLFGNGTDHGVLDALNIAHIQLELTVA